MVEDAKEFEVFEAQSMQRIVEQQKQEFQSKFGHLGTRNRKLIKLSGWGTKIR